jgi:hypothetical protein
MHASRLRKIGWAVVLLTCTSLYLALHLRVNAVKSDVRLAERRIVALQQQKTLLETEFETRSNQQQLADWNEVEFGYQAPKADQYLAGERQLAQFGTPPGKGAPAPITVASAPEADNASDSFASFVAPLAGRAVAAEIPKGETPVPRAGDILSARLTRKTAVPVAERGGGDELEQ